jgi:hypothetical protein
MHAGDRTGAQRRAVHDRSVQLVPAVVREHGAFAGVEARRILEHDDRFRYRIKAAAAVLQHGIAGNERGFKIGAHELFLLGRQILADDAGDAVNDENGRSCHRDIRDQEKRDQNSAESHAALRLDGRCEYSEALAPRGLGGGATRLANRDAIRAAYRETPR